MKNYCTGSKLLCDRVECPGCNLENLNDISVLHDSLEKPTSLHYLRRSLKETGLGQPNTVFMHKVLALSVSTFGAPARLQTYWSRGRQPILKLRSWISKRVSPYSRGHSQSTAPHWQACSTWEPELAGALLAMHEGGWSLWLSAPDSVAVPLLHVRRGFTHCLPQQELHCAVKFTIEVGWEK